MRRQEAQCFSGRRSPPRRSRSDLASSADRFNVFPYREEEPRNGAPPISRPTVDLRISHGLNETSVRALVDTGSPFCVFGRAAAELIDIDMGAGRGPDRQIHILGSSHRARVANVELELPPFEGLSWDAEVCFLYADLELSFVGVLGQEGFLNHWVASFNYSGNYFVIEEPASFEERIPIDPYETYLEQYDSDWSRPSRN